MNKLTYIIKRTFIKNPTPPPDLFATQQPRVHCSPSPSAAILDRLAGTVCYWNLFYRRMAARRIGQYVPDWIKIATKCPAEAKPDMNAIRMKYETIKTR